VERNTPLLVFGRAEDLRMRAAELLERPDVGVFGVRVYRETAVERERIGAAERVPKVLEPHGGLGVPPLPQRARQLRVNAYAPAERLQPGQHGRQRAAELGPLRQPTRYELVEESVRLQNSELTRVAQRLGVQLARRQPVEQLLHLSGRGNHENAVAATQAGFDKGEGRLD